MIYIEKIRNFNLKVKTRLKCKSSARVKIVLKKDWIVKLKNVEKKCKKNKNV